jgi:subtilisin family serine protease
MLASLAASLALTGCATSRAAGQTGADDARRDAVPAERQIVVTVRTTPARTALHAGSTLKSYDAAGRYQVSPAALRDAVALAQRYELRQVDAWPIELLSVHCIVYEVGGARAVAQVMAEMRADRRVESVQPLSTFSAQGSRGYDDPYLGLQTSLADLQVEAAHRWSRGRGVRIAVIDSGIDGDHPDLAGRVASNRDYTGNAGGDRSLDTHGLAVAGIMAAVAGNGIGIVGVAPEATVLALRACWQSPAEGPAGGTPKTHCNSFTLAQAIVQAIAERADVLNLSLSGPPDPLLERLLRRAIAMGKVVVAAVPEQGGEGHSFPATLPGVLPVASAEVRPEAGAAVAAPLQAPGRNVLTLRPRGRYDFENGSSMATAEVSGVVALLLSVRRDLPAEQIRQLLQQSAAMSARTGSTAATSVNACVALAQLLPNRDCRSAPALRNADAQASQPSQAAF